MGLLSTFSRLKQIIPVERIRSDKDTHFTGALAQNAGEDENLTGLSVNSGMIENISLQADQNLDWDIYLYATDGFDDTDLDNDTLLGVVRFVASDGQQIGGSNQYYYSTVSSSYAFRPFQYIDDDGTNEIHVKLVNRNATAKNSGATGEVVLEITFRPDETA